MRSHLAPPSHDSRGGLRNSSGGVHAGDGTAAWHPPQATAVTSLLLACIGWLHRERVSELFGWHASRLCCRDPGEWGPQPLRGTPLAYRNATGKTGMRRGSASRAGASQIDLQALPQAMMRLQCIVCVSCTAHANMSSSRELLSIMQTWMATAARVLA